MEVDAAREAFAHRSWRRAYDLLSGAEPLEADDIERLAVAAHLIGRDEASESAWERAHHAWLAVGDRDRAARCGFYLGMALLLRGEGSRGGGWLARAERLVEDAAPTCASRGLLLVPATIAALAADDAPRALSVATEMLDIAHRCGDPDLLAFGLLCRGEAALALGDVAGGLQLLDEAMVSVSTGEVSPIPAGIVYCAVIESCMFSFDLRRAAEWTSALQAWCTSEPDLVPYRGQCLVHRSQVLQAQGNWDAAGVEVEHAGRYLAGHPALGAARYQEGELHRLRGDLAGAAAAYQAAAAAGRDPAPGVALLRLAEGDVDAAVTAIRRMLREGGDPRFRPAVLAAAVDVHLAAGDADAARAASDELATRASTQGVPPLLRAIADFAAGSVLLADGDVDGALATMRQASAGWRVLGMPYETARAGVGIALACRALGDEDAANAELDAARATFQELGAALDLARVDSVAATATTAPTALSPRELEVLRLLAAGRTNREIAAELVISNHTVARHVQNTFAKLGVSSRAAATAYAYEHGLVQTHHH